MSVKITARVVQYDANWGPLYPDMFYFSFPVPVKGYSLQDIY